MGWNGSNGTKHNNSHSYINSTNRKPSATGFVWVLLVTVAIVCVYGIIIRFWHSSKSDYHDVHTYSNKDALHRKTTAQSKGKALFNDDHATRSMSFIATNQTKITRNVPKPVISMADVFYECRMADGTPTFKRPIFDNSSENYIAGILTETPGVRFLELELGEDFDEQFAESLKSPIEINLSDSDDDKLVKQAVIAAKQSIERYMKEGMKPSEIVTAARDEMNKIADYREQLDRNLQLLMSNEEDPALIRLYVAESNTTLAEYGAPPIILPDNDDELLEEMADARITSEEDNQKQDERSNNQ